MVNNFAVNTKLGQSFFLAKFGEKRVFAPTMRKAFQLEGSIVAVIRNGLLK
jgi:hypothetical protein